MTEKKVRVKITPVLVTQDNIEEVEALKKSLTNPDAIKGLESMLAYLKSDDYLETLKKMGKA